MNITVLGGLLAIVFLSTRNWRRSINSVFIIIVFEGALRKWVLPGMSDYLYFLKDFILVGAYWKYFFGSASEPKYKIKNSWLNLLIFFSFAVGVFQALNPSLGSPIVGLIGLRAYFIYIPLIWVLPTMFRSEDDLIRFLRWNLLLVIPVTFVGIAQYFSPADSWINGYAPGEVDLIAVTKGGAVRITSTFSFINSFQGYLIGVFALALPLAFIRQNILWQAITFLEIAFIVGCSLMTGSRTPVYTEILVTAGYIVSLFITQPYRFIKSINNFIVPTVFSIPFAVVGFRKAIESFRERAIDSRDVSGRIANTINEPLAYSRIREGSGYGIGATHPGSGAIRGVFGISGGDKVLQANEAEPGKVMLELGPYGFVVWYALRISILLTLGFRYFQLKRPFLKNLTLTVFLTQLIQLPGQVVFHHTFGLYYWLFSSFIFVLPQIELWEAWYEEQRLLNTQEITIGNQTLSIPNYQESMNSSTRSMNPKTSNFN